MKIIKLNNRFRQYKEYRHQIGIKFELGWCDEARKVESACRQLHNTGGWMRDADWYSYYGKHDYSNGYGGVRAYWITLKNEADLSAVLLMMETMSEGAV